MNFEQSPEFEKELKRFAKKWRTLPQDINDAQLTISAIYTEQDGVDMTEIRSAFFDNKRATVLTRTADGKEVVKMRLDVAALGTGDKVRIVFVAVVEMGKILFIELFAKNEKNREDNNRIKKYLAG